MIRLGIVDFDSSHAVEFTKRLNHQGIAQDQWVEGARIVMGCSLPSAVSPERIDGFVKTFTGELGLPLVARPEEMIGKIDGVLIESVDGSVHWERAKPFLEAGIPTYIDKPFASSLKEARRLVELAERRRVPIFSSSSLRYAPDVVNFPAREGQTGKLIGCEAYSPASLHPRNPGLFHYGIHGVETLYALMGAGCSSVSSVSEAGADVVIGQWKDGRLGTFRGIRTGAGAYGFTAYCEKEVVHVPVGTQFIYRELLKQIVSMFQTGQSPLDPAETLEIVAFIEAARHSAASHGAQRPVST